MFQSKRAGSPRKDGENSDNDVCATQETIALTNLMSRASHELIPSMTESIDTKDQHRGQQDERQSWLMRSVRLSLEISRSVSSMCDDSSKALWRRRYRSSSSEGGIRNYGGTGRSGDFLIFNVGDILVHVSGNYDMFGVTIQVIPDQETKEDQETREGKKYFDFASTSDLEESVFAEKCKLFTLGYILGKLYESIAPFPTFDPTLDLDFDGDEDEEQKESSLCSDDNNPDPPAKKRREKSKPMVSTIMKQLKFLDNSLRESGIPTILCELVDNLLLAHPHFNRNFKCFDATVGNHANYYTSVQDVISDLERILSDPDRFLFEKTIKIADVSNSSRCSSKQGELLFPSDTIYGRESHKSQLLKAFDRNLGQSQRLQLQEIPNTLNTRADFGGVTSRHEEIVLLSGYSGSGKTALVLQAIQESGFHDIRRAHQCTHCVDAKHGVDNSNIDMSSCSSNESNDDTIICFLSGKFDGRMHQAQPLSAIVSAIDGYCLALLKNEVSGLNHVRTALKESLGSDYKVLTDVIPNLSDVIFPPEGEDDGKPEGSQSLSSSSTVETDITIDGNVKVPHSRSGSFKMIGQEAKNRLNHLFCKFIRAISRPTQPIVLFLDDLHWADVESLQLIRSLVGDGHQNGRISHFLFLGSYRDNEVSEGHVLNEFLQRIENEGVVITNISVGNMTKENVNELLSDSLQLLPRLTKTLADIVHSKTNGNALFVRQFVTTLVENGSLWYSAIVKRWTWDSEAIRCNRLGENAAVLMIAKMRRSDLSVQRALMIAACLGSCSEKNILQKLDVATITIKDEFDNKQGEFDNKDQNFCDLLDRASSEGLITQVGSLSYRFPHDVIQFAAYSVIYNKDHVHLEIGRQLWKKCSEQELDEHIFIVATQLNEGSHYIMDHDEKVRLAELNLIAGEKCMKKTAFSQAVTYLHKGVQVLQVTDWKIHHKLCLNIYNAYAEVLCAVGDWYAMKISLANIFTFSRSFDEKIQAHFILTKSLGLQGRIQQAITSTLEVLSHLGEDFPQESDEEIIREDLLHTQVVLEGHTLEGLVDLEKLQDAKKRAAMKFLTVLSFYLYYDRRQFLIPHVIFRMIRISLDCGLCKESAFAFATFGYLLMNLQNDYQFGYRFGKVALSMVVKLNAKEYLPRVHFMVYGFINIWKEPLQACIEGLSGAYDAGILSGEVVFSSSVGSLISLYSLQCGFPLVNLIKKMRSYAWNIKDSKQDLNLPLLFSYLQVALNLNDCSGDPTELTGEVMDQNTALKAATENEQSTVVIVMYFLRAWMSYLFGRYDLADEMLEQCRSAQRTGPGQRMRNGIIVNEIFYGGLVAFVKARETKQPKWKSEACRSIEQIEEWTETASWNLEHKLYLLQAELFFLEGMIDLAQKTYKKSIDTAKKHRFLHEEALACERAGIFHVALDNHITAKEYFSKSYELYLAWGAKSKAEDVLSRYL